MKVRFLLLAVLGLMGLMWATACEEEDDGCNPSSYVSNCEDEQTLCICNSNNEVECSDCNDDCLQWPGQCVETHAGANCLCVDED